MGAALALPPAVAFAAPVVQAVAVAADGGSYAGVLGGDTRVGSRPWIFAGWIVFLSVWVFLHSYLVCFCCMVSGLYEIIQYTSFFLAI